MKLKISDPVYDNDETVVEIEGGSPPYRVFIDKKRKGIVKAKKFSFIPRGIGQVLVQAEDVNGSVASIRVSVQAPPTGHRPVRIKKRTVMDPVQVGPFEAPMVIFPAIAAVVAVTGLALYKASHQSNAGKTSNL